MVQRGARCWRRRPARRLAGGDDYDAANDTEGAGPAYFGFVRDDRGSPVSDAQVMLRPKTGDPVTIKTNVLGLYRSHISKDVVPGRRADLLREERLQADQGVPPHAAGRQGHVHRDRMHVAAVVARAVFRNVRPWFETRSCGPLLTMRLGCAPSATSPHPEERAQCASRRMAAVALCWLL